MLFTQSKVLLARLESGISSFKKRSASYSSLLVRVLLHHITLHFTKLKKFHHTYISVSIEATVNFTFHTRFRLTSHNQPLHTIPKTYDFETLLK